MVLGAKEGCDGRSAIEAGGKREGEEEAGTEEELGNHVREGAAEEGSATEGGNGKGGTPGWSGEAEKGGRQGAGRNSAKLANLLLDKAVAGKLEGARLLVKLAESKKPPVKPKRTWDGKTYAEMLASEPEWEEPEPVDSSDLDEEEKGTEALASQRVSELAS